VFEILVMNDGLRSAVLAQASTQELREAARRAGMRTLREAAVEALLAGRTTIEEVLRETAGQ
jgi:type II secretory ATPase GspE/PulE/Tfp pilus assembly ATPase PilB-like protein